MGGGKDSSGHRLPLVSDRLKRSASDASSSDGGSSHASVELGPYHILVVRKGPSRRPVRLGTLSVMLLAAMGLLLLLVYRSSDGRVTDRVASMFQLPTALPGRFDDMALLRRMRAARARDPPRMMTLMQPDPAAEEAAERALKYAREIAELEWKQQMKDMTAEERRKQAEAQAAAWKRQWESLSPAQQEQQRRKWKADWERKQAADRERKRGGKKAAAKRR